ncbi:MAG: sulfatase-like hydrolase/transferase, partial [Ktedonobacteraceae bacterium]
MSRRTFLVASALTTHAPVAAASALAAPAVLKGKRKRNVLFIATDDMCNRLGCYDVPVKSPNLDRLAQSGVRFDHHYCQYPLCGPSRVSLMTGLGPDTTKVWDLHTDFRDTIPQAVTISQLFQKNDYFVGRAGKIYHYNNPSEIGTPGFDDPASWQRTANPAGYDRVHDEALVTFYASSKMLYEGYIAADRADGAQIRPSGMRVSPSRDASRVRWLHGGPGPSGIRIAQDGCTPILPLSKNGDLGIALADHPSDGDDKIITDYMVAEAAIALLEEHKHEPWFLGAGFYRPHVPFIVPSKYFDMYRVDGIQIPPFDPSELTSAPRLAYNTRDPN